MAKNLAHSTQFLFHSFPLFLFLCISHSLSLSLSPSHTLKSLQQIFERGTWHYAALQSQSVSIIYSLPIFNSLDFMIFFIFSFNFVAIYEHSLFQNLFIILEKCWPNDIVVDIVILFCPRSEIVLPVYLLNVNSICRKHFFCFVFHVTHVQRYFKWD